MGQYLPVIGHYGAMIRQWMPVLLDGPFLRLLPVLGHWAPDIGQYGSRVVGKASYQRVFARYWTVGAI
jgi:hypothetical protein